MICDIKYTGLKTKTMQDIMAKLNNFYPDTWYLWRDNVQILAVIVSLDIKN